VAAVVEITKQPQVAQVVLFLEALFPLARVLHIQ
jgi:hypothetical protein